MYCTKHVVTIILHGQLFLNNNKNDNNKVSAYNNERVIVMKVQTHVNISQEVLCLLLTESLKVVGLDSTRG